MSTEHFICRHLKSRLESASWQQHRPSMAGPALGGGVASSAVTDRGLKGRRDIRNGIGMGLPQCSGSSALRRSWNAADTVAPQS